MELPSDRRVFIWVFAVGLALLAPAGSVPAAVSFYASFQGTHDGRGLGATAVASEGGTPKFVAGKRGQGLLTGSELGHLKYTAGQDLPTRAGTMEFWVCPEDWRGMTDEEFHVWFVAQGPEGWLQMYKYYQQSRLMFFLTGTTSSSYTLAGMMVHEWKPGQWHHLVGTWSPLGSALYVDGKLEGQIEELKIPKALPRQFGVGDHTGKGHSRIDELYLYDRPLTKEEVAWTFAHTLDRPAGRDVPTSLVPQRVRVQVKPSPMRGNILVQVLILGADLPPSLTGDIKVTAGPQTRTVPVAFSDGRFLEQTIDLKGVPGGEYPVEVTIRSGGDVFGRGRAVLPWAGTPSWRGSGVGLNPVVSAGYEPIRVEGNSFRCIGRDYQVGELGLPRQIRSAGQALLGEPIRLEVTTDRGELSFKPMACRLTAVNEGEAALDATSAAGGVMMKVNAQAWFDGLMKYTLQLRVAKPVTLTRMVLHIPMSASVSEIYHYSGGPSTFGRLAAPKGVVLSGPFGPFIWTGNNDAGLMFMCESDEPFANATPQSVYRFVRTERGVEMQVTFANQPLVVAGEWKAVFGLQASPVRPLEKGWRKWTVATGSAPKVGTLWPTPPILKHYGYPEAGTDEKKLIEQVTKAHNRHMLLIPYINPSMLSGGSPEWKQFGQDWKVPGLYDAYCTDVTVYGNPVYGVSSSARDWQDFLTWKTRQFLKTYGLDGLYYDHSLPVSCDNELLGEGYTRNGTRYPTYNIFSKRELYRRLYNMVKGLKKDTFILAHTSDQIPLPYLAFCDGYTTGEVLYRRLKDNYLEIETIDYYRAQFVGHQWGCKPYWLDEISGDYAQSAKAFGHWTGLCLLFDSGLWPVVGDPAEANAIIEAIKPYGWEQAEFLPYWKNQVLIGGQTEAVKASAYRTDKGVLLAVLNLGRKPQAVTLGVQAKGLGLLEAWVAKDVRTGKAVEVKNGAISLSLGEMGLRLIFLEGRL